MNLPAANLREYMEVFDTLPSVVITNYHLAVDTFFLMGGLLVTWSVMNAHERGTLNVLRMIYHRYIRYTPPWAAMILFNVSLWKFFVSDPLQIDMADACRRLWWAALLHIQNYVDAMGMCLNFSW